MICKNYNELSKLADELDEKFDEIEALREELKNVKSLEEYHELVNKTNLVVEEYNRLRYISKHLENASKRPNPRYEQQVQNREKALKLIAEIDKYLAYADDTTEYEQIKKHVQTFVPKKYYYKIDNNLEGAS